ncbi:uncharacterized protein LOC131620947 [Vicia villosa]|uniref:uncharacterized protein LOC131620947 n=1 Tax=Vicia villosa TaxID=3911 RepID=UPI00273C449A|nr:uncharacterized protein LOC131620947 [Vicia villosa]XP_058748126.1 uncharacterized protein LOC131620947 [Vicia villosa]
MNIIYPRDALELFKQSCEFVCPDDGFLEEHLWKTTKTLLLQLLRRLCSVYCVFCSYLRRGLGWHLPKVVVFQYFGLIALAEVVLTVAQVAVEVVKFQSVHICKGKL